MYLAMDEIGFENAEKIKTVDSEADRWRFIFNAAQNYGFEGVHFTPSLYKNFNLDLKNIPDYFHEFRLSLHFNGNPGITDSEYDIFDKEFEKMYEIALKHNMHDISIHPPPAYKISSEKDLAMDYLSKSIEKWLKKLKPNGITLSLETHVAGDYFLIDGLHEYVKFTDKYPDLGVLIDISHNYYNPEYSEHDIVSILGNKNVKGLHISDALRSAEFEKGTHLAIGEGEIKFPKLLKQFSEKSGIFGALEIKATNDKIHKSLNYLKSLR